MVNVVFGVVVLIMGVATAASAQEPEVGPSPFFECPYINYFDNDCPQLRQLWEEQERRRLEAEGRARQEQVPVLEEPGQDGVEVEELEPERRFLLFPKDSLAPDTPELYWILLADPTLANARRYVRWYAERTVRLQAVQALIEVAGNELKAELGGGGLEQ